MPCTHSSLQKYYAISDGWCPICLRDTLRAVQDSCAHSWKAVWLTEDLEGFRCELCGKEVLDLEENMDFKKVTVVYTYADGSKDVKLKTLPVRIKEGRTQVGFLGDWTDAEVVGEEIILRLHIGTIDI